MVLFYLLKMLSSNSFVNLFFLISFLPSYTLQTGVGLLKFLVVFLLTVIWVGCRGLHFTVGEGSRGGGRVNILRLSKTPQDSVETRHWVCKQTWMFNIRKHTFQNQDLLSSADVNIFFNNAAFFSKNSIFTQGNCMRTLFSLFL